MRLTVTSMNGGSFRAVLNLQDPKDPKFFVELIFPKFKTPTSISHPFPILVDPLGVEPVPVAQQEVEEGWRVVYDCTRLLGNFKVRWPDLSNIFVIDFSPLKITVKGENTFVYELPEG